MLIPIFVIKTKKLQQNHMKIECCDKNELIHTFTHILFTK